MALIVLSLFSTSSTFCRVDNNNDNDNDNDDNDNNNDNNDNSQRLRFPLMWGSRIVPMVEDSFHVCTLWQLAAETLGPCTVCC